jgi:hypothetical protein
MSTTEYIFAVTAKEIKGGAKAANKRHALSLQIAEHSGYTYYYSKSRHQWVGHGYCKNIGHAHNARIEAEIIAAWKAAGV